jgi:hypothetical protein
MLLQRYRWGVLTAVLLAGTLAVSAAYGQGQPGQPIQPSQQNRRHLVRGTITSVAQGAIVVTGRDGKAVTVKTAPTTRIVGRASGTLQDVKAGDRVRVLANKAQDGSLTAERLEDIPASLRLPGGGRGGQRELQSGKVIVAGSVVGLQGNVLSVAGANAAVTAVTIPQGVQVQRLTALPLTSLAQGTRVALQGTDNADGSVTAAFIMVAPGRAR